MVGTVTFFVTIFVTSLVTISKTILNTPDFSKIFASFINPIASSLFFACTEYFSAVCGSNPRCPITGIPESFTALIISATSFPPSNFTACAPASTNLFELAIAKSSFS